jgi:ankyrin repeat protein
MSYTRTNTIFGTLREMKKDNDIIFYLSTDNYTELIKLINEENVNSVIDTKNGYTALHYAIKFNNKEIILYLLKKGANPKLKTRDGQDCFDLSFTFQSKHLITKEIDSQSEKEFESKRKISELEKQIRNLETNQKYLNDSLDKITLKNDSLNNTISENKSELMTLRKENLELTESNRKLKRKYDELNDSYSGLVSSMRKK